MSTAKRDGTGTSGRGCVGEGVDVVLRQLHDALLLRSGSGIANTPASRASRGPPGRSQKFTGECSHYTCKKYAKTGNASTRRQETKVKRHLWHFACCKLPSATREVAQLWTFGNHAWVALPETCKHIQLITACASRPSAHAFRCCRCRCGAEPCKLWTATHATRHMAFQSLRKPSDDKVSTS